MRVNAKATEALARACLRAAPDISRFLFVSSIAAAGPAQDLDHPVTESDPPHPINWYGKSKLAAEEALLSLRGQLPVTVVRPTAVFGPRDRDFLAYFRLVLRGLEPYVGDGDRWISLIYVRDLVSLMLCCSESNVSVGQVYFGCGETHTRHEFTQAMAQALEKRTRSVHLPLALLTPIGLWSRIEGRITGRPALLNEQRILDMKERYWVFSGRKAQQDLGFTPEHDLQSAIRETADWYRQNRWL
jgi:nucleoside-diphosphate-sugar epimerase